MSNLIEQAAKRLEELRRAGVDVDDRAPLRMREQMANATASTPEATVLALEARNALHAKSPREQGRLPGEGSPLHTEVTPPGRHLDIDFGWLKRGGFVTPEALTSKIAEEFRVIKRPIIRNALGKNGVRVRNGNLVMVTSALPAEGKTFTSINLALSMAAEIDSTVLLVDGDVAHPSIPSVLGAPHGPGLLDLLTRDDLAFGDALVKTNVEKMSLLPAGSRHRRSTELLASEQMASLLREIASRY